ncbi:unnamed protein product [marine sediment metagenome]|uniref:Uncharacterized protein n=1 Tax=marine sediment metagenome TaxID=412755 RepID=X1UVE4_9ZZZZ
MKAGRKGGAQAVKAANGGYTVYLWWEKMKGKEKAEVIKKQQEVPK